MKSVRELLLSQLTKPNQALSITRILHALTIKNRLSSDPFYATRILRFYAINNDLVSARKVFDKTPERSVYLWNSVIRAYAQSYRFLDAFFMFKRMLSSDTHPDNRTFACIARACTDRFDMEGLRVVHGKVIAFGLGLDFICNSMLVSCYSNLGLVDEARFLFCGIDEPDLVLWNAMISGYGSSGDWVKGMELFNAMQNTGIRPDGYTMVGVIVGLNNRSVIKVGETIHAFCVKCGWDLSDHVGCVLVSMYSRCKSMELACKVFDSLIQPDLVSWTALITGFSQAGDYVKALMFFRELLKSGKRADPVLLASVLASSAQLAIVGTGCEIHGYAIRHECDKDVAVSSALVDMYAKCGFLEMGIKVFKKMPKHSIVTYNTMISSLGLYGRAPDAFQTFDEFLREGFKPDETTFIGLLSACCHSGLVNEGREYFRMMKEEFGIQAKTEHYVHMVKLLGMDGKLEEAYDVIKSMAEPVDSGIWGALLSCFSYYKNYELLKVIAKHLLQNETGNSRYRVMLSNLFAADGEWDCVNRLRVDTGGAKGKVAGISWISDINH